jgi:NAD+ diphosphatase
MGMDSLLYTAVPLDRAAHLRRDEQVMARLAASPTRRVLPCWRDLSLIADDGVRAVAVTGTEAAMVLDLAGEVVFLGLDGHGAPVLAADLSSAAVEQTAPAPVLGLPGQWTALRGAGPSLLREDAAVLAFGRAMLIWARRTRFCGTCGGPTAPREGGHVRACLDPHCGTQHHPRTDPAVIMLVEEGDSVLLHRQHGWPEGMWSILAGFVEPGETLEEAVIREVHEETGITVEGVAYAGCQPWPFPSSLMVGFTARANGGTLVPCSQELEDARWFGRNEINRMFDDSHRDGGGLFLPWHGTIARRMLDFWRLP